MTAYRRGVYREKRTADHLRDEGYVVVESRGSHGVADLVALKWGQCLLVQVKTKAQLTHEAWNGLYDAARETDSVALVADWPKRGTLRLRRITGLHEARSQRWPCEPFLTDEAV